MSRKQDEKQFCTLFSFYVTFGKLFLSVSNLYLSHRIILETIFWGKKKRLEQAQVNAWSIKCSESVGSSETSTLTTSSIIWCAVRIFMQHSVLCTILFKLTYIDEDCRVLKLYSEIKGLISAATTAKLLCLSILPFPHLWEWERKTLPT